MNSNQVKVLMIVNPFPPLGRVGASIRTVKFIEHLDPEKWKLNIVTQDPDYPVYPMAKESCSTLQNIPLNVQIYRIKSKIRLPRLLLRYKFLKYKNTNLDDSSKKKMSKGSVLNYFRILRNQILIPDEDILWALSILLWSIRFVRQNNIEFIYASGPPFSSVLVAYLAAKITKRKLIFDMKDDWREVAVRLGKNKWTLSLERRIESSILKYSSAVLIPTKAGIDRINERNGNIKLRNLEYLPNGCDISEFKVKINEPLDNVGKTAFTIVCGVGGLSKKYRDIQPFLESLVKAKIRNEEFGLRTNVIFLGSDLSKNYQKYIQSNFLGDMLKCYSQVSREEYVLFLMKADLLLLVQINNAPSSISGTLYEYWSIEGIPIMLIGGLGETRNFLIEKSLGYAFDFVDVERMTDFLLMAFTSWLNGCPLRTNPIESVTLFDRKELALKFEEILLSKVCS